MTKGKRKTIGFGIILISIMILFIGIGSYIFIKNLSNNSCDHYSRTTDYSADNGMGCGESAIDPIYGDARTTEERNKNYGELYESFCLKNGYDVWTGRSICGGIDGHKLTITCGICE